MENYIVRIYRHGKDNPNQLMGIVEKVGEEGKKAFTHFEELKEILNVSAPALKQKKKSRRQLPADKEKKKNRNHC